MSHERDCRGTVSDQAKSAAMAVLANTKLVLDCLPRAVVVVDLDATIVGWNNVSTRFYGWTEAEALGQSLDLITPPALRDTGRMILDSVFEGKSWSDDVNVLLRSGEIVRTFSFLGPLVDADGTVVGALAAADDEAKLLELTARTTDLTDRLMLALSAGRLGTWQWDMASGVTTWDAMTEQLFGFEPGGFGGTFAEYVARLHPEDRDTTLATVQHAVATATDYEVENRVVLSDGTVRWLHGRGKVTLDADGTVTGTIGCTTDITDRKLAETNAVRRLREAEAAASRERLQRERLEFLTHLNDVTLNTSNERELLQAVASAAVPQLGDWCSVYFMPEAGTNPSTAIAHSDPDKVDWANELLQRYPYDPYALTGVPAVIRSGRTEYIEAVDQDELHRQVEVLDQQVAGELHQVVDVLALTSMITVPLLTRRGVVGAIQFVSAESGRRYEADDVALAEAAAGRVGEALWNAWLMGQQRDIATTLQAALLPPKLPQIPGVTVATRYWAAGAITEVGGDFYDVFPLGPQRWAIVIGDVCGTGPRAAAVTGIARHTIRAAATHGCTHSQVLEWVNDAIAKSNKETFCTVVYSTLELGDDGRWTYTCALGGHPRPVVIPHDAPAHAIGTPGSLIGVLPVVRTFTDTIELHPGDTVVLYTDGVTDLRPPNDLDEAQLVAVVERARSHDGTADDIAANLGNVIQSLVAIEDRHDDVALLVIRIGTDGASLTQPSTAVKAP